MAQIVNPGYHNIGAPQLGMPQWQPPEPEMSPWEHISQQFSSSLGQGLGGGIQQGIKEQLRKSLVNKALSTIPENANPEQTYRSLLQLDPETRQEVLPLIELRQAQQQAQAQNQEKLAQRQHEIGKINLQNQGKMEIAQARATQKAKKGGVDLERTPEEKEKLQTSFDSLVGLLKKGNLGNPVTTGGILNRDRQEDIGEFDTHAVDFISILRKLENQGHITDQAFKTLLKSIPSATDSDRTTQGKLKAIAQKLGLDASQLSSNTKQSNKSSPAFQVMTDPNTGESWEIQPDKVSEALAAGWK